MVTNARLIAMELVSFVIVNVLVEIQNGLVYVHWTIDLYVVLMGRHMVTNVGLTVPMLKWNVMASVLVGDCANVPESINLSVEVTRKHTVINV